jgi:uncharacterized membrane protein YraQ (UPF0718 family)
MAGLSKEDDVSVVVDVSLAFWGTLCDMAPYLLFGFLMAGALSVLISPEFIQRHLGKGGIGSILKASFFGVPLPLCSCSVIPVATSLRRHGASKGATTAFLLSTPQTGVDSIMATFALLGPVFAVFRPLAAFVSGVLGGVIVEGTDSDSVEMDVKECTDECCSDDAKGSKLMRIIRYGFVVLPKDIAKPLLLGLVIAGGIAALVPETFFAEFLGVGILSMLVMMLLGIPVYVCATASIPVAAAMMLKGVTPGAARVFLMTGPATNAAAIAALWKIMGKKTTLIYMAIVAGTALGSGLLLDFFFDFAGLSSSQAMGWMLPESFKVFCALLLIGILGAAIIAQYRTKESCCAAH